MKKPLYFEWIKASYNDLKIKHSTNLLVLSASLSINDYTHLYGISSNGYKEVNNAKCLIFNADKEPNNLKLKIKNSTLLTEWYREFYSK
jgi:hypothetical protein